MLDSSTTTNVSIIMIGWHKILGNKFLKWLTIWKAIFFYLGFTLWLEQHYFHSSVFTFLNSFINQTLSQFRSDLLITSSLLVITDATFRLPPRQAGILAGSLYWTVRQGVWGDQQDVTETMRRWQEYIRSINTRRPPTFDKCGNVVVSYTLSQLHKYQIHPYEIFLLSLKQPVANSCDPGSCSYVTSRWSLRLPVNTVEYG